MRWIDFLSPIFLCPCAVSGLDPVPIQFAHQLDHLASGGAQPHKPLSRTRSEPLPQSPRGLHTHLLQQQHSTQLLERIKQQTHLGKVCTIYCTHSWGMTSVLANTYTCNTWLDIHSVPFLPFSLTYKCRWAVSHCFSELIWPHLNSLNQALTSGLLWEIRKSPNRLFVTCFIHLNQNTCFTVGICPM